MKFLSVTLWLICSTVFAQSPGQILDQDLNQKQMKIDSIEMELIDIKTRLEALENNVSDPDPDPPIGEVSLVTADNLTLVGGFKVPANVIDGQNTRYTSGSFDRLNGKWIANHGTSRRIIEYMEPPEIGTGSFHSWPELIPGRNGHPFQTVDKISASGVYWLDGNLVLCSGRKSYRSGFEKNWICTYNLETGQEVLIPQENPDFSENQNFHLHQAFGTGFCRVPNSDRIGIGRGGYDVLGSPLGPALALWSLTDPYPSEILIDYDGTRAPRDANYYVPEEGEVTNWLVSPVDGVGLWTAGTCSTWGWVDHPNFRGLLNCAFQITGPVDENGVQLAGTIDYRAQGDGGSGGLFGVTSPATFYSENSSGGNRGQHEQDTHLATLPPAVYQRILYVYDPNDLEAEPNRYPFPFSGITISESNKHRSTVRGLFWDNERQLLWACITNIHTNGKYAVLAAYQLGGV